MEALLRAEQNAIQVREISAPLLADFISFVDRSDKTTRTYITNLKQFFAWMKKERIAAPTRRDIICYRDWLTTEHDSITLAPRTLSGWAYRLDASGKPCRTVCKPTTAKLYLQSVKQFFKWTAAQGIYPDVAANIHTPKITDSHKKDSLTAAEVLHIENSITDRGNARIEAAHHANKDKGGRIQRSTEQALRLRAMYLLAVNAGLRTIEISRANIRDIETKGGKSWLYIWGKGRSAPDQKKPIVPEVKAAIDEYIASRTDNPTGSSPLFVSTGNRSHGKRIASTTISTMLKRAMQEAGFDSERLTAHSLRHSTAQNVMQLTGRNIYETQQYLRHSSPKTTEIYLEQDSTEQDERIAAQLYRHYHGMEAGNADTLPDIAANLTPDQMKQLAAIAKAMQSR